MGARVTRLAVAAAIVAVTVGLAGCGSADTPTAAPSSSLPTRTIESGAVTVKIEPRRIDAGGAVFKVIFDTHSVDLNQDLARARLTVDGTTWPYDGWSGDEPGGHHREGQLRFTSAGTPAGTATLTFDGLPTAVTATWELP